MSEPWNFTEAQRRQFREAHADQKVTAMGTDSTTTTSRLTEWDRLIIADARRLAAEGIGSTTAQSLAREVLRRLADLAEQLDSAPVAGYLVDGKPWHPSDVTIVRETPSSQD